MKQSSHWISSAQIKKFAPLGKLSDEDAEELLRTSTTVELGPGKNLFNHKQDGKHVYYLISGAIELKSSDGSASIIEANSISARKPLGRHLADQESAKAVSDCVLVSIDMDMLELFLNWTNPQAYVVNEIGADKNQDWVSTLLKSKGLNHFSDAQVENLLARMNEIHYRAGDVVVSQDTDDDDFYYFIKSGKASVSRKPEESSKDIKLADLTQGDGFGEEALLTQRRRTATVTMTEDGDLMRLSKKDFSELLAEPMIKTINWQEAQQRLTEGAVLIDTRTGAEFEQHHLPGAINIPLPLLRLKLKQLDREQAYIAYCGDGSRSSAAAFIMNQQGLEASVLDGGMDAIAIAAETPEPLEQITDFLEELPTDESIAGYATQEEQQPPVKPTVNEKGQQHENSSRTTGQYCSIGSTDYWGAPLDEINDSAFEDSPEVDNSLKTSPAPTHTAPLKESVPYSQPEPMTLASSEKKIPNKPVASVSTKPATAEKKSGGLGMVVIGLAIAASVGYGSWLWLAPTTMPETEPTVAPMSTFKPLESPASPATKPATKALGTMAPATLQPLPPAPQATTPEPAAPTTLPAKSPAPTTEQTANTDPAETTATIPAEPPKKAVIDPATRGFIE